MEDYNSRFSGEEVDQRLAAIATMQTALESLTEAVAAKYSKPAGGIPETDLDEDVRSALALARSAVQSLSGYYTSAQVDGIVQALELAIAAKYSIPSGGIPASDLASAVQASLGKADTSVQPAALDALAAIVAQKYVKPASGIPASDLAAGVIPDVSEFVTKSVNDLVNYYLKSETYTKAEVQQLIAAIQGLSVEVVASLPTASADTMRKIYLVPSADPQTQNVKDEYITIDNGADAQTRYTWEQIGSTAIDLSGYVTTTQLNTALADYTTTANLTTLLAAKQDTIADLSNIRTGSENNVKYTQQSLTDEQKEQARTNIAAAAAAAISALETAIAAKYSKPSGGIPSTDMDADVQAALAKAQTAIQSLADYYTKAQVDAITAAVAAMVNSMAGETVTSLPTASSETLGKMYYVGPDANDEYERYFTSYDGSSYYWTAIGSTAINLYNYAQKSETIILSEPSDPDSDIEIGDDERNIIFQLSNGHIKTKAFDSSKLHTVPDKSIICIGDSLTMGTGAGKIYPDYLQALVGSEYVVDNLGEGGDKIQDIMARTNAFPAVTAGTFTIPASGSVAIGGLISSYDYARKINLLKQSQAVFNPVEIMGVKGYLVASGNYEAVTYTFTRLVPGTAVTVPKWTPVYGNEGLNLGNSKVLILWGGQNGLFSDEGELVAMNRAVVEAMGIRDYCVIGPTNNDYQYDAYTRCVFDYDTLTAKMRAQFGCRYIDMLGYFLTDALSDAGITPTASDTAAIANDKVPPSLLADTVHFNATGFELVANKIYQVLTQLNYL